MMYRKSYLLNISWNHSTFSLMTKSTTSWHMAGQSATIHIVIASISLKASYFYDLDAWARLNNKSIPGHTYTSTSWRGQTQLRVYSESTLINSTAEHTLVICWERIHLPLSKSSCHTCRLYKKYVEDNLKPHLEAITDKKNTFYAVTYIVCDGADVIRDRSY